MTIQTKIETKADKDKEKIIFSNRALENNVSTFRVCFTSMEEAMK